MASQVPSPKFQEFTPGQVLIRHGGDRVHRKDIESWAKIVAAVGEVWIDFSDYGAVHVTGSDRLDDLMKLLGLMGVPVVTELGPISAKPLGASSPKVRSTMFVKLPKALDAFLQLAIGCGLLLAAIVVVCIACLLPAMPIVIAIWVAKALGL
jgi:hypothetical protein